MPEAVRQSGAMAYKIKESSKKYASGNPAIRINGIQNQRKRQKVCQWQSGN